ncbi:MAG TPA: 2-oxoglutarate and iron-dependent oxygenase domain-containing protein [Nostocaceae cyanobacterium]|nr:2-oxoglutarate and iron-dependent oxygenase domain-containing protein [Nostocaceae cyanobacterium]
MMQIPLINLAAFTNGNLETRQIIAKQIYQACQEIGFMYLQNFSISSELIEQVFNQSQHFFNLPLETKQQLAWTDKYSNVGYVGIERESLNPQQPGDLKEAFNILAAKQESNHPAFSPAKNAQILGFMQACTALAHTVLEAFALALELPIDYFTTRHNQQNHTLRLLHYPPLTTPVKPGQIRAGEHSDYGSITLLFQDLMGGLELQTKDGKWITAPSIPQTVIVNTGDLMQRWTNRVFCSTKHRVILPDDSRNQKSRYSIAFFCHPNHDTEIACLESCKKEPSDNYPPILAGEYLISRLKVTFDTI